MYRYPLPLCGLAAVLLLGRTVWAEHSYEEKVTEAVTVPLDQIWAWDMPGTRDIRSLEPEFFGEPIRTGAQVKRAERSLISRTRRPLASEAKERAGDAFAVAGIGREALEGAHAVLAENRLPQTTFSTKSELSVVFYSHVSGTYVHISEVRQRDGLIEIQYEFMPHIDAELTFHLALIRVGRLAPGEVEVKVVRLPLQKKYIDMGVAPISKEAEARIVCKSFSFKVAAEDVAAEHGI